VRSDERGARSEERGARSSELGDHAAVTVAVALLPTAINGFLVIFSGANRGKQG
jgi:hypothetical protein